MGKLPENGVWGVLKVFRVQAPGIFTTKGSEMRGGGGFKGGEGGRRPQHLGIMKVTYPTLTCLGLTIRIFRNFQTSRSSAPRSLEHAL